MSTSILNTLKLTAARKSRALPDVVRRRNKLLLKLTEQRELAAALEQGRHYAPKRLRSAVDTDTGTRVLHALSESESANTISFIFSLPLLCQISCWLASVLVVLCGHLVWQSYVDYLRWLWY